MTDRPYKIKLFISHSSKDKKTFVEPLVECLKKIEYDVWIDKHSIPLSKSLFCEILKGVKQSDIGIIILSEAFLGPESKWTTLELGMFLNSEKPLYFIFYNITLKKVSSYFPFLGDINGIQVCDDDNKENIVTRLRKEFIKVEEKIVKDYYINKIELPYEIINYNEDLEKQKFQKDLPIRHYVDFLKSNYLKYYSRETFKKDLKPENQKDFLSENDILKFLDDKDKYGIIIHGQGGIGKTRLMLELGRILVEKGFLVLRIQTNFDDIKSLTEVLNSNKNPKNILLIDYIESHKKFSEIINLIKNEGTKLTKIIGNCRNTFIPEIQFKYSQILIPIDIGYKNKYGEERKCELNYKNNIINAIIDHIEDQVLKNQLKKNKKFLSFFKARPSFAVFIKYLNFKSEHKDIKILKNDSFSNWLFQRLIYTIDSNNQQKVLDFLHEKIQYFQILSCLPLKKEKPRTLNERYLNEINTLEKDGWIDESEVELTAVHDTVSDLILVKYLEQYKYNEIVLKEYLEFANDNGSLSSLFYSFERMFGELQWEKLPSGKKQKFQHEISVFLIQNLNEDIATEDWVVNKMITSQLLEEKERIDIIIQHKELLNSVLSQEEYGSSLAYSMEWVSENIRDDLTRGYYKEELKSIFSNKWNVDENQDAVLKNYRYGGKIISSYIKLCGIDDYISLKFYEYIKSVKCNILSLEFISYVLVAWFDFNGEVCQNVINLVGSWFTIYEKERPENINYVPLTTSWLEKGDDPSIVKNSVIELLNNPSKQIFVKLKSIKLWRQKSEDIEILKPFYENTSNLSQVKDFIAKENSQNFIKITLIDYFNITSDFIGLENEIIDWLNLNSNDSQNVYFLGSLLKNINKNHDLLTKIENHVKEALKNFITLIESGFIIGYWLEKGGDRSIVEPYINTWFKLHGISEQGGVIIGNWLERGGDYKEVKEFIIPCIEIFINNKGISKLMLNWIVHGDNPYFIKKYIISYFSVKENQIRGEDHLLITCWLENTHLPSILKDTIKPWLTANSINPYSIYVCSFWLEKGGEIELVENYISNSFINFADIENSYRVIESWLKRGGNTKVIEKCIEKNLNKNGGDINAVYTAKIWIEKSEYIELIENYIENKLIKYTYRRDTFLIILLWLRKGGDYKIIKLSILDYLEHNWELPQSILIIKECIKANELSEEIEAYVFKIKEENKCNPFIDFIDIVDNKIIKKSNEVILANNYDKERTILEYSYFVKNHLKSGKSLEDIKEQVLNFIIENKTERNCSQVLYVLIKYGNDFEMISDYVKVWIKCNFIEESDLCYIISAALQIEEGFKVVCKYAIKWLNNFGYSYIAKYPLSSWLKYTGNEGADEIRKWVVIWVKNFYNYDTSKSNWRDEILMNHVQWLSIDLN